MSDPATTSWLTTAARTAPDAIALVAGTSTLTFGGLAGAAALWREQLADDLPSRTPSNVGVVVHRTPRSVAQLWAVWESPHVAVLLDSASTESHNEARLRDWGIAALIEGDDVRLLDPSGPPADPDHHSWILTSGSTAAPRPVVLTHANLIAAVTASQRRLGNDATDRWQLALPLDHVGGASILWRSAAAGGAVVLDDRFDARRTARQVASGVVTISSLVPTMLHRLLDAVDGVSPEVKAVLVGGAATHDRVVRRALDAGLPIVTTYGLTEACSQVATVAPGRMRQDLGTVGAPLDGMEVTIAGPHESGAGIITLDGPAVSPGYGGEPKRHGPFTTGDLGRLDDAGRLIVLGRHDDVIVSGGDNVAPRAVEDALTSLADVEEAVVVGVPDAEWGEAVVAIAVVTDEASAKVLAEQVRSLLRPAARPKRYVFVGEIPLLPNGKPDRAAARAIADRR